MNYDFLGDIDHAIVREHYAETSKPRMLIVTLVEDPRPLTNVAVLNRPYEIPEQLDWRKLCINGMTIDRGYTEAVFTALREETTYIMFIEDDTFPPLDAITRLVAQDTPIIGGWYPQRNRHKRMGIPHVMENGVRRNLDNPDGKLHIVETIPMGCTLMKTEVFRKVALPWFVTKPHFSQDVFFSQRARQAGYTLWCDTSILCKHIDRKTGEVFE